ncbi:MAG: TRIC cation channel family protein [Hydrogenophaga sp.]|nr:TRIC cation channel family protein [Hydrogenophaga sp.]
MVISAPWWLKAVLQDTDARLEIADAFGPGLFAISGTSIAMAAGMSASVSVLLGATTAIDGGFARDVLRNEVSKVYLARADRSQVL